MIIAQRYTVEQVEGTDILRIRNLDAPLCPLCGALCSGYDTRSRHSIDRAGFVRWFALRRLRCSDCKKLHIELPDFMTEKKHYEKSVITAVKENLSDDCPADNVTMWRWKR